MFKQSKRCLFLVLAVLLSGSLQVQAQVLFDGNSISSIKFIQ